MKLKFPVTLSRKNFTAAAGIVSLALLSLIVFLLPVEFSAYRNSDTTAPFWYLVTQTGGPWGASVIIVALAVVLIMRFKKRKAFLKDAMRFIAAVIVIQLAITLAGSYFLKRLIARQRPSVTYLQQAGIADRSANEFYSMPDSAKKNFTVTHSGETPSRAGEIYPPILESWISDSGYSFPSGHSQTSFFLATVLSFVILNLTSSSMYALIPFVWAILTSLSRVVIGIHYPLDAAAGALIGLAAGLLVINLKPAEHLFENIAADQKRI